MSAILHDVTECKLFSSQLAECLGWQDAAVELDKGEDSDAAGACDKAQPAKRRKGSARESQPAAQPGKVKAHGAAGARLASWE